MNQWWILFCIGILAATGFTGERFGEDRVKVQCDKHDEAQQEVTIAAQKHVITEVQTQGQITQEAENAYHTGITAIDGMYAATGVQSHGDATSAGVRPVPATACGTQTSRKYRLTPKQCDEEEAKCNALWNWAEQQAAVK
jgi:hypothetical protein